MASIQPRSFGELLKRYRVAAGLTQEELADRARLSARAIGALETGARRAPRKDTVSMLADALRLSTPERALLESAARPRVSSPLNQQTALRQPTHSYRQTAPLAGRVDELALLQRHLEGAGPPLLLLAGEPGMGKTRLLHETLARAQESGWTTLMGGCTRRSGQEPFTPILTSLAHFVAARPPALLHDDLEGCAWLVRLLPELAERGVTPTPTWTLTPEQERRLMFNAVERMLVNVAGPAGTLVLLDDLQWAGPDALDLLGSLARAAYAANETSPLARRPVRLLGAYRATEVAASPHLGALIADLAREELVHVATLGPLAPAEARKLLTGLLADVGEETADADNADREQLSEQVLARAGGVPFFLISCAQAVAARPAAVELPWTVQQSLRQRVTALPEAARALLGLAAVAGREMRRSELLVVARDALALDQTAALAAIEAACEAALLAEDERGDYRFPHDLIREAMLADLSAVRRAAWGRVWAETLERLPEGERVARAAEVAWHFARADEPRRALPYALMAGDRAAATRAHGEAERHYAHAAELAHIVGDVRREAEAREKWGDALYLAGRHAEARAVFDHAAQLHREAGDNDRYAWTTVLFIRTCLDGGDLEMAVARLRMLHQTLATAQERAAWSADTDPLRAAVAPSLAGLAPRTAARVCLVTSVCVSRLGWLPEALTAAERARAFAQEAGDQALEAVAHMFRGVTILSSDQGHWDDAYTAFMESIRLAEASGDLDTLWRGLVNGAEMQTQHGASEVAIQLSTRAIEAAERLGAPIGVASARACAGKALVLVGRWAEARAQLEQAIALLATLPPSPYTALTAIDRAWLTLLQGDPGAPALIEEARALTQRFVSPDATLYIEQALGEMDLLEGRYETALRRLEPLIAHDGEDATHGPNAVRLALFPLLAWAEAERGDDQLAASLLSEIIDQARQLGSRPALADALRVQALLATRGRRWAEAEAALAESLALCRAIPYPYAEAKAQYARGQLALAYGEPEQGRKYIEEAQTILERLGERLFAEHIERALAPFPPRSRDHSEFA